MNKKKGIILGIICLIVLLAIGLGLFFISKNSSAVDDENNDIVEKDGEKTPEKKKTGKPLLYKVTKDGKDNVLYLFGSIHVADERAYPMGDAVLNAYKESEALIVEFDLVSYTTNVKAQYNDVKLMLCENGKTLKDYLKPEVYDKVIQYMKDNNVYNSAYESYKPAFIYSLLTNVAVTKSELDSSKGIDMYFLKMAHKDKKEIVELETSTYQMETLLSFSDDLYNYMLDEIVSKEEDEVEGLKTLYDGWLNGNIEEILSEEGEATEIPEDLLDDLEAYNNSLLIVRNEGMINKIKQSYEDGKNTFLVVGIAHIVGEDGIAKVLEDAGYKVEKVDY